MPTLNDARDAIGPTLRTNLFDITFDVLPGFPDLLKEKMSFLACRTEIPGITGTSAFGLEPTWSVTFLLADLDLFDAFMEWESERLEELGEATITIYNLDGSKDRSYKVTGMRIVEINSIYLEWEPATMPAKLDVSFRIESCKKVMQ